MGGSDVSMRVLVIHISMLRTRGEEQALFYSQADGVSPYEKYLLPSVFSIS